MPKRILIILMLALVQFGCGYDYGDTYKAVGIAEGARQRMEQEKRDFLQLEDIVVGTGPIATWNRRISARLNVKYEDGTPVYEGPAFTLIGFQTMPATGLYDYRAMSSDQPGILLGLNGMAVGGRRRIIVDSRMVCAGIEADAPPTARCHLVGPGNTKEGALVRKNKLIVEATLTEACVPFMVQGFVWRFRVHWEFCLDKDEPRLIPGAPLWQFY